jgi:hypothetical protein
MSVQNFRLYQLTLEYERALDHLIPSEDGNIDEALINEIKDNFELKCINVAKYIKCREAEYLAMKEAVAAMTERAKKAAKRIESLTEYLRFNLEKVKLEKPISCPEFDIKLAQNPPSLVIYDTTLIPDMYKVTEEVIVIDKALLKQDIKDGFEVEGARIETKMRVVIK